MNTREVVMEVVSLIVSAELVELGARLGHGTSHSDALERRVRRLLASGADADDVARIVDAGRRAGALLATIDVELPPRDPAAELCKIGERHVRKQALAARVDETMSAIEVPK